MLKFEREKKGSITQGVRQNLVSVYKKMGLAGHSGIDWYIGHGKTYTNDNDGFVYKTYEPFQLKSNWTAVYMLCPMGEDLLMEISYGHNLENLVSEGDEIKAGTKIARQGNYGTVFSNGVQVSVARQKEGTKDGSHVHEGWRPIRLVDRKTKGQHYLRGSDGKRYKYNGKYCEIINKDNGINGHINPMGGQRSILKRTVRGLMVEAISRLELELAKLKK